MRSGDVDEFFNLSPLKIIEENMISQFKNKIPEKQFSEMKKAFYKEIDLQKKEAKKQVKKASECDVKVANPVNCGAYNTANFSPSIKVCSWIELEYKIDGKSEKTSYIGISTQDGWFLGSGGEGYFVMHY